MKALTQIQVLFWRLYRYVQDKKIAQRPRYNQYRDRFYRDLWQETARRLDATVEDVGYGFLKIAVNSHATFVQEARVMLDNYLSLRIAGNKPLVHRMLTEQQFPVQDFCEFDIHHLDKAWQFIQRAGAPCVVKPAAATGAGNGITTKIRRFAQLRRAALWAATFSDKLLIEKEIPGHSYRLLYLNGDYIDAVRRNPPHVEGDGIRSIRALVHQENQRRLNGTIRALSPLTIDYECRLCLTEQGRRLSDVPAAGERVSLKTVVNQNAATENETVTHEVHSDIVAMGAKIARLFQLELVGVDLITTDITRPLRETGGVINEINTCPGLHHHYLVRNRENGSDVASSILKFILSEPGSKRA